MRTKRGGMFNMFRSKSIPDNSMKVDDDALELVDHNNDTSYSLIVSHNSRIQCLLGKLGVNPGKKIRFKNCCILEIVLTNEFVYVKLIYAGEISKKDSMDDDKIFYTDTEDSFNKDTKKLRWFKPVMFTMDKKKMGLQNVQLNNPHVFYLVRHGQSLHNETKTRGLVIDTPLTPDGEMSANRAATALDTYLKKFYIEDPIQKTIRGYFVSDLYRTRQTMNAFRGEDFGTDVYVLPCESEVGNVGVNGDCDSSGQIWNKLARENYSDCSLDKIKDSSNLKCRANWDTYLEFYGNQIRGQSNVLGKRMRCRDTNMLAMAIYMLDFKENMSLDTFMTKDDTRFVPRLMNTDQGPLGMKPPDDRPPEKEKMTSTSWFSYGGTKHRKLKRHRTRRRR